MMDEVVFPNRTQNQVNELKKLAEHLSVEKFEKLELRVKKLEGELMALKARSGKHG